MIKFFRKIRYDLMNQNKNTKYLKYAIGEIVLVVIGILIALSINNWNEERLTKHQIKSNLTNLSSAIKQDYDLLKLIEDINDFRSNSVLQILKWTEIPLREIDTIPLKLNSTRIWDQAMPETFNLDFFDKTFLFIGRPRLMIIQYYAMEEFKNSGLYSNLNNQQLKNLLNEYYTDLEWFFRQDEFGQNESIIDLRNYLRDNYNLRLTDIPLMNEPLALIKNDPGFIVRLRDVQGSATWRLNSAKTSKMRAEVLLNEIKKEIDK